LPLAALIFLLQTKKNTRLRASFPGQPGKSILNFNEASDDGVAVATSESYVNHLQLPSDR